MDGWALHHTRGIQGCMHTPTLKNMQVDVTDNTRNTITFTSHRPFCIMGSRRCIIRIT
jgi:hypothetical protein